MRPRPARLLLTILAVSAFTAAGLTSQLIFVLLGMGAAFLLATSFKGVRRPLPQALLGFRKQAVEVRVWGVPPPLPPGTDLVLASVNVLGAGLHVFFNTHGSGSIHLKVAQPGGATLGLRSVVIDSARYVQWSGKKLTRIPGAPALSIALIQSSGRERPESVA